MQGIQKIEHATTVKIGTREETNAKGKKWLAAYRENNLRIFRERPVRKSKYSSIQKLEELLKEPAAVTKILPEISGGHAQAITFEEAMKTMPRVIEKILSREEPAKDQFGAFVDANFNVGFVVLVGKECDGKTIEVALPLKDRMCTKGIFIIESGIKATVIETIHGEGTALYNETLSVEEGANTCFARIHSTAISAIDYQQCIVNKDAGLVNSNAWLAGGLVRANACIILDGAGSRAEDFSVLLATGKEQYDLNYSAVHRAPDSFSHNVFNSVLKDESRAVYAGMIRIEPTASKTNALLETHSMILGNKASSNQIPQLEIRTDDVKATHSATVAHVEDDELFYMEAKGIPSEDAKKMVVQSFLEGIVAKLPEKARERINRGIERKL